jgi:hypothetical protein
VSPPVFGSGLITVRSLLPTPMTSTDVDGDHSLYLSVVIWVFFASPGDKWSESSSGALLP